MNEETRRRAHWSFWIIGVVALIWHVLGTMNFFLQMNANRVAEMPESFRVVIESRPSWATGAFAVAVIGGAVGCVLLLLKRSESAYLFVAATIGVIVQVFPILAMDRVQISIWIGSLMSLAVAGFLYWYSTYAMRKRWIK